MPGRTLRAAGLLLLVALGAASASAQDEGRRDRTYLWELALLVDGARRLISLCEGHALDAELAKFAHPLSSRYVEMAGRMLPPTKIVVAHPHLLVALENLESALDAAAAVDASTYQKRMRVAREELLNLEAILKQLKLRLPELPR